MRAPGGRKVGNNPFLILTTCYMASTLFGVFIVLQAIRSTVWIPNVVFIMATGGSIMAVASLGMLVWYWLAFARPTS